MEPLDIRNLFARHDLRWTRQREEVYLALAARPWHPTAEELFNAVGSSDGDGNGGGTSLATVYNTLEALVRCGLARKVTTTGAGAEGGGACRYDAEVGDHAHLVTADGRIVDVPDDLGQRVLGAIPREVVAEIERRLGIRIERVSVEFVQARDGGGDAGNG